MVVFTFTAKAKRSFDSLPSDVQNRILNKFRLLKNHADIMTVIKRLHYIEPVTFKLRVGSYRLLLNIKKQEKETYEFWVSKVGHRKDIYSS